MSFGTLEQNNYDNEQQEYVIQETRANLSDLKDQIESSLRFSDDEKNTIESSIDHDINDININSEQEKTQVESPINHALGSLLANIKSSTGSQFEKTWNYGSQETYQERKQGAIDQHSDRLISASMDNYFNNHSHFNAVEGSADRDFIDNYNNNMEYAAHTADENISNNLNLIYPPQPVPKNVYEQKADHSTDDDIYFHQYQNPKRATT